MNKGFILLLLLSLALPFIYTKGIIGSDFVNEKHIKKTKIQKNDQTENLALDNAEEVFDFWDFAPQSSAFPGQNPLSTRRNSHNKQKRVLISKDAFKDSKVYGTLKEQNQIKEIDRFLKEIDSVVAKLEKIAPKSRNLQDSSLVIDLITGEEDSGTIPEEEEPGTIPEEEEPGTIPEEEEYPGTIPEEEEPYIPEEEETGTIPEEEENPGTIPEEEEQPHIPEEEETGIIPEEEEQPHVPEEEETGTIPEEEENPGTIPEEEEQPQTPEEEETEPIPEEEEEEPTVPEEEETEPIPEEEEVIPIPSTNSRVTGSIRYNMTLQNFEAQNGRAKFITETSRIIGIPASMIRIMSIRTGSVIVDFEIAVPEGNGITPDQAAKQVQDITAKLDNAVANGEMNIYGVGVMDYDRSVIIPDSGTSLPSSNGGSGAGVAIGLVLGLLAVVIIVLVYILYKRKVNAKAARERAYKASKALDQMRIDFENQSVSETETKKHRDDSDSFSMYKIK